MRKSYDVVVVGARPAGATLAIELARAGVRVAVLDRTAFPSDTMSTHVVYPNTIARLKRLGALEEILAHRPPPLYTAWHHAGEVFVAPHTPEQGRDWALCVRRITLDEILVDCARAAGAEVLERTAVSRLMGAGTPEDPVRGVVARGAEGGELELEAPLVVGADGVVSTVARSVGAERHRLMPTPTFMAYAYWDGLPSRNMQEFFFEPPWIGTHFPTDDGHHLVILIGPVELYDARSRDALYLKRVSSLGELGERVRRGRRISGVVGTKRLEGFYRSPLGPGWALSGDSGHFKHPAAVQGIGDAIASSEKLAQLIVADEGLGEFEPWREEQTLEMYAFSRFAGGVPTAEGMTQIMDAAVHDADIARGIVDIWSRGERPWDVIPQVPALVEAAGASPEEALEGVLLSEASMDEATARA